MNLKKTIHSLSPGILAWIPICLLLAGIAGCAKTSNKDTKETQKAVLAEHPQWTQNANIYEVNIRQYTPEGTFKAFQKHLPRLQKMGVDFVKERTCKRLHKNEF